jgi:Fanconi-associated nuclease 1
MWNAKEGICKFVEVKGPGDTARPNQKVSVVINNYIHRLILHKLWFDALLRAGAHVEICRVIDQDAPEPQKRKRKTPSSKSKLAGKGKEEEDVAPLQQQDSDDDGDYLPSPVLKRRHRDGDGDELSLGGANTTPTRMIFRAALPRTPSSSLRARSVPLSTSPYLSARR